jgi:hypothetical protein
MGRQIQIHATPADINQLIIGLSDGDVEMALKRGNAADPERLAFIPDALQGHAFVLWSERFAAGLQRDFVAAARPPYYVIRESEEPVLELTLSAATTWQGQAALTQGRIYGMFEGKPAEFERWYERIVRYIRRHWRKNPVGWMSGYIGPAASEWFEQGGLLLPNYVPPVRGDWIARLGEQHSGRVT